MRSKLLVSLLPLALSLGACAGPDLSQDVAPAPLRETALLSSSPMPAGIPVKDAPPGFISFCSRFLDQCVVASNDDTVVHLNLQTQGELDSVNRNVNEKIAPEDDEMHYGRAEYWNIPSDGYGNCKDYAVTKRKELIDAGLPERALRVAIVMTPRESRHAVLTVTTDRGDLVLDNLSNEVKPWSQVDYRWLERQDGKGSIGWVALDEKVAENPLMGPTLATK